MTIHVKDSKAGYGLRLEGEAGIEDAIELREALVAGLGSGRGLNVHLGAMTRADVTVLQLLWVARREASHGGTAFRIEGEVRPEIRSAFEEVGLATFVAEAAHMVEAQ